MTNISILTDIETKEVSLVKRGANRKMIALSKTENQMDILKAVLETEVEGEAAAVETFKSLSEKGQEAATGLFRLMTAFRDELGADGVANVIKAAGFEPEQEVVVEKKEDPKVDLAELNPATRAIVEKSEQASREAVEKADALAKQLDEERDLRRAKEWTEKAESKFSHVPAPAAELAVLMKSLSALDSDAAEKVEALLEKASEAIQKSDLLAQKGRGYSPASGSAWDAIVKGGQALNEAASEKVTTSKSIDLFLATPEGKDLYQEYLKENKAQTGIR